MIQKEDIERIEFEAMKATEFLGKRSPYAELGVDCLRLIDEVYLLNGQITKCKKCKKSYKLTLPSREEA